METLMEQQTSVAQETESVCIKEKLSRSSKSLQTWMTVLLPMKNTDRAIMKHCVRKAQSKSRPKLN